MTKRQRFVARLTCDVIAMAAVVVGLRVHDDGYSLTAAFLIVWAMSIACLKAKYE